MIHYELALQLKEAGFPQAGKGDLRNENGLPPMLAHGFSLEGEYGNFVYFPTTTELTDACGDRLDLVHRASPSDWLVEGNWNSYYIEGRGETLDVAVANLYLELRRLNNHEIQQK